MKNKKININKKNRKSNENKECTVGVIFDNSKRKNLSMTNSFGKNK